MRFPRFGSRTALSLVVLGALIAAVMGTALSWDGSWYLFNVLESQAPFTPHGRVVNTVLQAPTLLAQSFTDRLGVLRLVFGMTYLAVPVVALVGSWLVVRQRRPDMLVWPALAICLATTAGQVNPSSEALQAAQLVWPPLLAAIVGLHLHRRDGLPWLIVCAAGLFVAVAHPFGAPLLMVVLLVSLIYRRWSVAAVAAALVAFSIAWAALTIDAYQTERLSGATISYGLAQAIAGAPLISLLLVGVSGACIAIASRSTHPAIFGVVAAGAAMLSVIVLIPWAADPYAWNGAIEFRTFAGIVILPMVAMAVFDGRAEPVAGSTWRRRTTVIAAAGFAIILAVQGFSIRSLDEPVVFAIRTTQAGCIPQEALPGVPGTMLESWATPSRSLLFGARQVTSIVLWGDLCQKLATDNVVTLVSGDQRSLDTSGWFDLRGLGQP